MKKIVSILSILGVILILGSLNSCSNNDVTSNTTNPTDTNTCSECIVCNEYEVGDTFSIDGVTYTVADREMLDEALKNGEDLTKYCTSKVTDMSGMFYQC